MVPAGMSGFIPPTALVSTSVLQPSSRSTRAGNATCCIE
jgi:hypothetical protein